MSKAEENAIFAKQKINFQPPAPITHLVVCNNCLALAMQNGKIRFIPLQDPEKQEEIDVIPPSVQDSIAFVHMDPTGCHMLVSTTVSADVFYIGKGSQMKPKNLHKLKGNVVSAVGWNVEMSKDTATGFIVVGTSRGLLFETEILSTGHVSYFRQLYCFSDDPHNPLPVVSLHMHSCSRSKENRWFIFATVPGRLYPFTGTISGVGDGTSVFYSMFNGFQENIPRFHSLSVGDTNEGPSELYTFPSFVEEMPTKFAWLAGPGLEYGNVDVAATDAFKMIAPEKLFNYPVVPNGRPDVPLHVIMTEYHFLLLFSDRLTAISCLNEAVMYEDFLGQKLGKIIGICRDPISNFIWVYSDRCVLKYSPNNETKHLWSIYLDQGEYTLARKFAANNPKNLDAVLQKHASKLMDEKKFVAAAEIFAMTMAPFEEVALNFIYSEDRTALKTFLQRKLDKMEETERTQKAMIVLWLLEVLLTEMGEARSCQVAKSKKLESSTEQVKAFDHHRMKTLREQFRMFLNKTDVMDCLKSNPQAVIQMMFSHGDMETISEFSDLMKDFDSVVAYNIQQERYDDALSVLKRQRNAELFYKYASVLILMMPKSFIDALISMDSQLKPKRILSAMFQCDAEFQIKEILRYLEFCTSKLACDDQAVHNFLLNLYSKHAPDKLMAYLEQQGKDVSEIKYDLKFALRICKEKVLHRPCVHLYLMMGLYEEALELALKIDIDIAKSCAKSTENQDIKRKLWLQIARYVVDKEQDIKKCVDLLQDSEGLIKIQDLLPFFPNFVTIDHFKESLCKCLAEHSGKIKGLQEEMKEATDVAQQINKQINLSRNKYVTVKVQEKCASCTQPLMTRSFYAFPCQHNFHADCIEKELEPLITGEVLAKLKDCKRQLTSSKTISDDTMSIQSTVSLTVDKNLSRRDQLLQEIDNILGADCPYCGESVIKCIDRPFFLPSEYVAELKKWE